MATPRPWLPNCGLTTTGTPMSSAASQASSAIVHRPALGHRHADGPQQLAGQILVLSDFFGDGAGAIGLGGQDAALLRAIAQLHQAAGVQPPGGNAPGLRRPHDRLGAGAQADALANFAEFGDLGVHVEWPIVDRSQAQSVAGCRGTARASSSSSYSMATL